MDLHTYVSRQINGALMKEVKKKINTNNILTGEEFKCFDDNVDRKVVIDILDRCLFHIEQDKPMKIDEFKSMLNLAKDKHSTEKASELYYEYNYLNVKFSKETARSFYHLFTDATSEIRRKYLLLINKDDENPLFNLLTECMTISSPHPSITYKNFTTSYLKEVKEIKPRLYNKLIKLELIA